MLVIKNIHVWGETTVANEEMCWQMSKLGGGSQNKHFHIVLGIFSTVFFSFEIFFPLKESKDCPLFFVYVWGL